MKKLIQKILVCSACCIVLNSLVVVQSIPAHDQRFYTGSRLSAPNFLLPGDILQGPAVHFGLNPLGLCHDAVGLVRGMKVYRPLGSLGFYGSAQRISKNSGGDLEV